MKYKYRIKQVGDKKFYVFDDDYVLNIFDNYHQSQCYIKERYDDIYDPDPIKSKQEIKREERLKKLNRILK